MKDLNSDKLTIIAFICLFLLAIIVFLFFLPNNYDNSLPKGYDSNEDYHYEYKKDKKNLENYQNKEEYNNNDEYDLNDTDIYYE